MSKDLNIITKGIDELAENASNLANDALKLSDKLKVAANEIVAKAPVEGVDPLIYSLTIFVLSCFVGYYVVWKVTPALHTPLMSVTNAISSIIIVGAIIAVGPSEFGVSKIIGFFAVLIASINIFGGFAVTQRMLDMFKKKQ